MSERSDTEASSGPQLGSLIAVVGWIAVGAVALATVLLVLGRVIALPFSTDVAVGLGLALGGGIGGVARLFRADEAPQTPDRTMTVDSDAMPSPEPADLFDGHPDPVLYYAAEGHGPVIRAANAAFGETFDLPVERIEGAPLSEALLVTGDGTVEAEAVAAGGLDRIVDCETTVGTERFRLRTVGNGDTGYLLYTPRGEINSAGA